MWRLCLLRDLADFKISLPALDADRTRPMAWPGASVAGRGGSRRMRPFNQVRVRVESGALSGASLSVVVIPAGPWASRGSAGPWGWRASWDALFLDQDSPGGAPTMPATNQWAVSTLIREVLADPDLAGRASSGVCPRAGPCGPGRRRGRRRDRRGAPRRAPVSAPTGATASASRRWPPPPALDQDPAAATPSSASGR